MATTIDPVISCDDNESAIAAGVAVSSSSSLRVPMSPAEARDQYQLQGLLCQWVDRHLAPRWARCASAHIGFRSGLRLVAIAESFTGTTPVGVVEDPRLTDDMASNVAIAFSITERFLKARMVGASAEEIVAGNTVHVLAVLAFFVTEFEPDGSLVAQIAKQCRSLLLVVRKEPWADPADPGAMPRMRSARKLHSRASEIALTPKSRGAMEPTPSSPTTSPPSSPGSSSRGNNRLYNWALLKEEPAPPALPPRPISPAPKPPDPDSQMVHPQATLVAKPKPAGQLQRPKQALGAPGPQKGVGFVGGARGPMVQRRRNDCGCALTDISDSTAETIDKIISLKMACNKVREFPTRLLGAVALEELDLSSNFITKIPNPPAMQSLHSLITLRLDLNPLGGETLTALFLLPAIRELSLKHCRLSKLAIPPSPALSLRTLELEENELAELPNEIGTF
jgi:hypothetical protein